MNELELNIIFYRRTNYSITSIIINKLQKRYNKIKKAFPLMSFNEFMDSYYIENKDGEMKLNINAILKIK